MLAAWLSDTHNDESLGKACGKAIEEKEKIFFGMRIRFFRIPFMDRFYNKCWQEAWGDTSVDRTFRSVQAIYENLILTFNKNENPAEKSST